MKQKISDVEEKIINYAMNLSFAEISNSTKNHVKRRVLDTIGGAIGAYNSRPSKIARKLAQKVSGGLQSRVWCDLTVTTPENAAFANGTMSRYLDINDTHRTIDGSHPSDNIGGLLALAEALKMNGKDFIIAVIISYEIQCRFVDSVPFNDNGWDQPVPGVIAMALAAGRMLGLSKVAMRDALALAIIPNLCTYQTRAGELSMWKGSAAANGARQGIFAARLAKEGMTGPSDAFDGIFGLWNQTLKKPFNLADLARGKKTFAIQQTNIKMFPVRDSCQLPINTAQILLKKINSNDINSLKIITYKSAYKGAVADSELWAPKTRETADHSMLVAVIITLLDGSITPETFERERFLDKDVLELINRTTVEVSKKFSMLTPSIRNCRLEAISKSGETYEAELSLSAKDIETGLSEVEIKTKFMSLCSKVMQRQSSERLYSHLQDIENLNDVSTIVCRTRI